MKARVFFDAFAECLVNVALARKYPFLRDNMRSLAVGVISARHGDKHADATGHIFDRLWLEAQNPKDA